MYNDIYDETGAAFDYHPDGYMDSLLGLEPPADRETDDRRGGSQSGGSADDRRDRYDSYYSQAYTADNITPDADSDLRYTEDGEPVEPLCVLTSDQLMSYEFERRDFIVENLLTCGLAILAGSPKIGKSWMVLSLCTQVACGSPFLGNKVRQGEVLYLALEDDARRLQRRLLTIGSETGGRLYLANSCSQSGVQLEEQIRLFLSEHPSARLVVIDTFQKIRRQVKETGYANDYAEVSRLKQLADSEGICILLVHHTRKLGDSDYMNEISGTTGISGSADTLMVLKKETRTSREAVLSCTGRDIEDREMTLFLDRETCVWEVRSDSLSDEAKALPEEIEELAEFMKSIGSFDGGNTDFCDRFCNARSYIISPKQLKQSMNLYRWQLEDLGVRFTSYRKNGARLLRITYNPSGDTSGDAV